MQQKKKMKIMTQFDQYTTERKGRDKKRTKSALMQSIPDLPLQSSNNPPKNQNKTTLSCLPAQLQQDRYSYQQDRQQMAAKQAPYLQKLK